MDWQETTETQPSTTSIPDADQEAAAIDQEAAEL
jgi:hypothetical protein